MAKNLVIVESPAKAKTIEKYLGKDYKVMASIGHIKDLPSKGLGVDVEHNFEPTYEIIPDSKKRNNKKVITDLKKAAKDAEAIYLAADPDREGEAICQHLEEEIVPKRPRKPSYRVMFNEITKRAVQEAFKEPRKINSNLVDAQQARRILDRLVGYKVSPLLCRTVGGRLSAGRVQSVALRMIVDREREIERFVKTEYWTITAALAAKLPPEFKARLFKIEDKVVKTSGFDQDIKKNEILIKNQEEAEGFVNEAKRETFKVLEVSTKERKRNPVPPFITSKLQQEASRKLGFPVKKTMMLAQKLYEGIELGAEGSVGLITYMRTDSTRISDAALNEVRQFIGDQYGQPYLPEKPVHYKSKKSAQDAHEAIRPTDVMRSPESLSAYLNKEELKLYRLIWQRFVASQMMPAIFDQTTIDIEAGRFLFRATGAVLKFDGFLKVYEEGRDEKSSEEDEDDARKLPVVERGELLTLKGIEPEQHFTEPPPRYTEATLVKALEEKGIGRPSTYAAIMTTIQDREYVEKLENRFHPTALGTTVNDLLVGSFDDLFNESYTARLEEELDEIEDGKLKWTKAIDGFYSKFAVDLKKAEVEMKAAKQQAIPTEEVCDKCGAGMVIKFGRFGQFLACSNYPECKTTRELARPSASASTTTAATAAAPEENGNKSTDEETNEELCDLCGKPMALKRGRFGQFLGCTGYPDCRNIRKINKTGTVAPAPVPLNETCPIDGAQLVRRQGRFGEFISCANYPTCKFIKRETTGVACIRPGCKGEIVVKKSKRGKLFYGCSEYPTCATVYWDKPVATPCPQCNAPFVLEKTTKKEGTINICAREECGYRGPIAPGAELNAKEELLAQ
jgi:DNA topoisomerase I